MPADQIERLVREEQHKEAVLKSCFHVEVTPALVGAEVQRIDATTRAPDLLAEIKSALGNDPVRFARSVARPIVIDRILRARFENDAALHTPQRKQVEDMRAALLEHRDEPLEWRVAFLKSATTSVSGPPMAQVQAVTWRIAAPRVGADSTSTATPAPPAKEVTKAGPYTNESTAQLAQSTAPQSHGVNDQPHFEDLPIDLQTVLRARLVRGGEVSPVIETPSAFLLFLCLEKTDATLRAHSLTVSKRSYENWLAAQPD